mgnify:CR=1 FL=1
MEPSRHAANRRRLERKKKKKNAYCEKNRWRQGIVLKNPVINQRIQEQNKNPDDKKGQLFFKKNTFGPGNTGQIQKAQKRQD